MDNKVAPANEASGLRVDAFATGPRLAQTTSSRLLPPLSRDEIDRLKSSKCSQVLPAPPARSIRDRSSVSDASRSSQSVTRGPTAPRRPPPLSLADARKSTATTSPTTMDRPRFRRMSTGTNNGKALHPNSPNWRTRRRRASISGPTAVVTPPLPRSRTQRLSDGSLRILRRISSIGRASSAPSTSSPLHEHHLSRSPKNQPRSAVFLLAEEQSQRSRLVLRLATIYARTKKRLARVPLPLFDPRSNWKLTWDSLIMLMVLYSAVLVPVQVGFPDLEFGAPWWSLNIASDVLFWLDVAQNFFVGYYEFDDEAMVRDRARIARRYLWSWFLPDVVGLLPIEQFAGSEGSSSSINSLKLTRIVRLFRVTKLARLIKLRQFAMKVEDALDLDAVLTRMTQLIGLVLLVTHILSCLWHLVGQAGDAGESWIAAANLQHEGAGLHYLYAFYWVATTLAGVGFGDLHATNTSERLFSIFAEVVGACGFGYLIGNITKILENWNREKSTRARKLSMVQSFVQKKAIPKSLKTRLLRYFRHYIAKTSAFDERELLCEFSLSLRGEILRETYKNSFFLIPALQALSPQFVMDMAMFIKPLIAVKGDVLAKEGSVGTEMFILNSGIVEVRRTPPVVEWIVVLEILTERGVFGESSLLNYTLHQNTYTAKANCDLYTLPKEDFDRLIEEFPDAEQTMLVYHQKRSELYDHVFDQTIARYRVFVKSRSDDPVSAMVGIENIYPTLTVLLDGVLRSYRTVPIHILQALALDLSMGVSVFNSATEKKRMMELLSAQTETTVLDKAAELLLRPINPFSTYKLAWDSLNGLLLLFVGLTIPFEIAFFDEPMEISHAFELFMACVFALDIVVSLRTAVIDKTGHIVIADRTSWREYLRLWFWVDLLAVLPWTTEHALRLVDAQHASLLPLTMAVRLLKLARVLKLVHTLTRAENMVAVATRHTTMRVLRLLFKVVFIAHLMSCGLMIVSKFTTHLRSPGRGGEPSSIMATLPPSYDKYDLYVLFLYWAITTMTTVGYGDNPPENPAEVAYVALGVLIGASTFTYVVGTFSSLVDEFHRSSDTYRERMDHLKAYLRERMIPRPLSMRLRRYYQYYLLQRDDEHEDVILSSLSDNLRSQLVLHLNRDVVSKIGLFAMQDDACVSYLMGILDPEFCTPGEFVFKEGQVGRHMYFLVKGVAEVLFHAGSSRETIVATLSEGAYFGEIAMLTRSKRAASIRAKTYISLLVLSRTGLDRISLHYPEMASSILLEFRKKITNIKKTSVKELGSLITEDLKQARVRSGLVSGGSLSEMHETLADLEAVVGRIVQIYGGGDKGKRKALACVMQHLHKYEFSLDDFLSAAEELSVLRESSSSSMQSLPRGTFGSGSVLNRLQMQLRRRSSFS